ncbi:hypothetical protein BDP27DRAFT_367457 [Rhodocollybia butyracea]|uniref:Uncharacterized protein n=1 Tax=Rhodocollybia butyracea TaxID=206335 RepID=A0A9P5Q1B8_9AGAR|nr:hypothetical protein BDP27DRAFT_367457 [Rhodocollybia butyracea]
MRKTIQSLKKKLRGPTKSAAGTPSHPTLNELLRAAEISIRLLKELSDTVPFIGSAASGAIFIIEQCKKYARNSKDFKDLLGSLETLKNLVSPYQDGNLPLKAMESIKQFDSVISDIRKEVESLESTGRISQFVNGSDNQDRVKDIIQRVKEAVDRVMLASMLGVSRGVEEVSYSLEEVFRGVNVS